MSTFSSTYSFSTDTSAAPSSGVVKLNNSNQNNATLIRISYFDSAGVSGAYAFWTYYRLFRGYIKIQSVATPHHYWIYRIDSAVDGTNWTDLTVVEVGGGDGGSNALTNTEAVEVSIHPMVSDGVRDFGGVKIGQFNTLELDREYSPLNCTNVSANYTASANNMCVCDLSAAAGSFTVNLPTSPVVNNEVGVMLTATTGNRTVTVSNITGGAPKIIGKGGNLGTSFMLSAVGDCVKLQYIGNDTWFIVDDGLVPHSCSLSHTGAAQSINSGSATSCTLNNSVYDVGGLGDTANNRIVIQRAGKYQVTGNFGFSTLAVANVVQIIFLINGGNDILDQRVINGAQQYLFLTKTFNFAAGDIIKLNCFQNCGAAKSFDAGDQPLLCVAEIR